MSTLRCILAFTWAHCWNTTFSNSAWERIKEKSGSSLCTKFPILSHCTFPPSLSPSPLCISYFHQILRQRLCDFLILVPLLSLSFLSVSETKVSVTFPGFVCVSLPPYLSSLCSAALDSSDICLSQCCHWVPCSGPASRCICRLSASNTKQPALISSSLTFYAVAVTVTKPEDPYEIVYCVYNS